jgi:hypothetical protein
LWGEIVKLTHYLGAGNDWGFVSLPRSNALRRLVIDAKPYVAQRGGPAVGAMHRVLPSSGNPASETPTGVTLLTAGQSTVAPFAAR